MELGALVPLESSIITLTLDHPGAHIMAVFSSVGCEKPHSTMPNVMLLTAVVAAVASGSHAFFSPNYLMDGALRDMRTEVKSFSRFAECHITKHLFMLPGC